MAEQSQSANLTVLQPFAAKQFLSSFTIVTTFYHKTTLNWKCFCSHRLQKQWEWPDNVFSSKGDKLSLQIALFITAAATLTINIDAFRYIHSEA